MPILLLGIAAVAAFFLLPKSGGSQSTFTSSNHIEPAETAPYPNSMNLPDVRPEFQQGDWSHDWDDAMARAGEDVGVPFALIKAHAIRESALKQTAYRMEPSGKASFGLMQILWWPGSNRFASWGYPDDWIGDGSQLYNPVINCTIACHIIQDNWQTYGNLRDAINAYNTGRGESVRRAPNNYVDDVLTNYEILIGKNPLA